MIRDDGLDANVSPITYARAPAWAKIAEAGVEILERDQSVKIEAGLASTASPYVGSSTTC